MGAEDKSEKAYDKKADNYNNTLMEDLQKNSNRFYKMKLFYKKIISF